MKALRVSFKMLIQHISRDGMLLALCLAPLLTFVAISQIIPTFVAPLLPFRIEAYYLLLDLLLAVMTPFLFCFASALAILEEIDENIAPYLSVTPLGKTGYLISRLIFPVLLSALVTTVFSGLWSLSEFSWFKAAVLSFSVAITALTGTMMIVIFAKNKVEGIALSKVSNLILVGLFIPFFMSGNLQYLFGFLPSFWVAKFALTANYGDLLIFGVLVFLWILALRRIYIRRIF